MNMQSTIRPDAPVTTQLAEFALSLKASEVPAIVRTRARHTMLDAAGIALASTRYPFAHPVLAGLSAFGDRGDVPVFGMPAQMTARDAAIMNGFLCHGLDYDDTHIAGIVHATASVLPACLSAAALSGASGRDLVTAYVVGIEAATRIGMCARGAFHQAGFHPTGIVGIFGCVLAAGRLLGLNKRQLEHAQGLAVSMAGGAMEFLEDGAWNKRWHPGWAASSALTACMVAREGFVGATRPYDGRYGLFNIFGGKYADWFDLSALTSGFGNVWELMSVAVKPFPTCHFTHAAIDCALMLRDRAPLNSISAIDIAVPMEVQSTICEPEANKRRPQNDYDAKFSAHFLVATALKHGKLGLAELEPAFLADPEVHALMDRTTCSVYEGGPFPDAYSGRVTITLDDGTVLVEDEPVNRGAADRPLGNAEIIGKFRQNAALYAGPDRIETMEAAMLGLDDAADARSALNSFGG
ncbi:MAG: MmgE/PrpD family protein [Pseudomonadota bacterium]